MKSSAPQPVVPGPAGSISGGLLTMSILRPHPRPPESKTLGVGPSRLCVNTAPGDSDVHRSLGTLSLDVGRHYSPSVPSALWAPL